MSAVSEAAARVYAKALFELGLGEGSLAAIGEDLHAVRDALNDLDGDFRAFFTLPQLRRDDKRRIIIKLTDNGLAAVERFFDNYLARQPH